MGSKRIVVLLIGLLLWLSAGAARAESKAAKARYDRGVTLYNLGHFAESIVEFEQAYQIEAAPILLYNIAQAHRQLGNNERAAFFYRRYIEGAPTAANRADVEKRMRELEELMKKQGDVKHQPPNDVQPSTTGVPAGAAVVTEPPPSAAATTAPPAPPTTATTSAPPSGAPATVTATGDRPTERGRTLRIAGIATAAGGGASLVAGVIFGAMASSKGDSVGSAAQFNPDDDSAGHRDATLQWVFYGIGAAAVVGGAALYYFGWSAASADARVAVLPSFEPGGASAVLRMTF